MNKREAKRLVCSVAAQTLENDLNIGASWIYGEEELRSDDDVARIVDAIQDFAQEMRRRAKGPGGEDE